MRDIIEQNIKVKKDQNPMKCLKLCPTSLRYLTIVDGKNVLRVLLPDLLVSARDSVHDSAARLPQDQHL